MNDRTYLLILVLNELLAIGAVLHSIYLQEKAKTSIIIDLVLNLTPSSLIQSIIYSDFRDI